MKKDEKVIGEVDETFCRYRETPKDNKIAREAVSV